MVILLVGCSTLHPPLPATEILVSSMPSPDPLPLWLREVRPFPSSYITQYEYRTFLMREFLQEGPPPPPVEETGFRSSVCVDLDVETLVEPGDFLFGDEDVFARTQLFIDGKELIERTETEYLAIIEPGPQCKCFYDCEEGWSRLDWDSPPKNVGCWFWPGFWNCYHIDLEIGEHKVEFIFEKTSGDTETYTWFFTITE